MRTQETGEQESNTVGLDFKEIVLEALVGWSGQGKDGGQESGQGRVSGPWQPHSFSRVFVCALLCTGCWQGPGQCF